jgi:hypothetical protein
MPSGLSPTFWDWLDEVPRTPSGVLVSERGETRVRPVAVAFELWAGQAGRDLRRVHADALLARTPEHVWAEGRLTSAELARDPRGD